MRKIFDGILILLSDSEVCFDQHLVLCSLTLNFDTHDRTVFYSRPIRQMYTVHKVLSAKLSYAQSACTACDVTAMRTRDWFPMCIPLCNSKTRC